MISALQHPRPHKSLDERGASNRTSLKATLTTHTNLRSHSLPTPSPSPAPSLSQSSTSAASSAFSSPLVNMLALGNPAGPFTASPFARTFSPFAPAFTAATPSRAHALRQCMPMTPEQSCLVLPTCETDQFESFRASKSRVVRLCGLPASPDASARAVASLFPLLALHPSIGGAVEGINRPTPVTMWTLRANSIEHEQDGERPVWAVFASHEEACAALSLGCESGIGCSSINVIAALESDLEPFSKLQAFSPKTFYHAGMSQTISTQSAMMGLQTLMRYPPSPTSTTATEAETEAELFFPDARDELEFAHALGFGYSDNRVPFVGSKFTGGMASAIRDRPIDLEMLQTIQACRFTALTNPPKARSGFRHGDWICAVPACAAHNFGRNLTCIQCSSPRPTGLGLLGNGLTNGMVSMNGAPTNHSFIRVTSPRFSNCMNSMQPQGVSQQRQQQDLLAKAQLQAQPQTHSLLTPSGRAFAVGGKVQNISPDLFAPCIMFWPDNEPFPDPGQIRPASLANMPQPPILNTGNKGPIERQPGDWTCQKCKYLNWRRRKVCQTCFPYAEGNGDSVSATMHAERLALLAAVYGQTHPQIINAQQAHAAAQRFPGRAQSQDGCSQAPISSAASNQFIPTASNATSLSLPNYPFNNVSSSSHRSQVPTAPASVRRTPIPNLSISTSAANLRSNGGSSQPASARRVQSIMGDSFGEGSIVYQTPPSPAVMRPPPSVSSPLALTRDRISPQSASPSHTVPLLPSFINREVQPIGNAPRSFTTALPASRNGTRSPASLSPASTTSADLPFEEHENAVKSVSVGIIGSGRNPATAFYSHPHGASSGSSMGSASSLTLSGGSNIWSLERDEDKAWNSGAFAATQAMKKMTL